MEPNAKPRNESPNQLACCWTLTARWPIRWCVSLAHSRGVSVVMVHPIGVSVCEQILSTLSCDLHGCLRSYLQGDNTLSVEEMKTLVTYEVASPDLPHASLCSAHDFPHVFVLTWCSGLLVNSGLVAFMHGRRPSGDRSRSIDFIMVIEPNGSPNMSLAPYAIDRRVVIHLPLGRSKRNASTRPHWFRIV